MASAGRGSRLRRILLVLGMASSLAVACSSEDTTVEGQVVLYTSMPDAIVERLKGVIERRFPDLKGEYWLGPLDSEGISLKVVRGRTADIQNRISREIEDGKIDADLIWLAEPSPYETYKKTGLLAPYQPPEGAPIPSTFVDPDGFYVAGRVISMVVAWNTSLVPDGLADWPDLHDVELAAFPAPQSGAARATIHALTDEYGLEFFTGLADNGMISVASNGAARDGVAAGTIEAVAVLDYMAREARTAGLPVDFEYPASGTVLIPSPIAITTDAANPAAAKAVVDFILSQSGQQIMVEIGSFYSARTDVAPPAGAVPLSEITALDIDWSTLPSEIDAMNAFWESLYGPSGPNG